MYTVYVAVKSAYIILRHKDDDEWRSMALAGYIEVLRSPARNDPRSGLVHVSEGKLFQSLAVQGGGE